MQSDRQARIRERAHQIWLDEGQVDGKDAEHWHRAEHEIAAEENKSQAGSQRAPGTSAGKGGENTAAAKPGRARAKPAEGAAEPKSEPPPGRAAGTTTSGSRGSRPTTK